MKENFKSIFRHSDQEKALENHKFTITVKNLKITQKVNFSD